jgi:hypothetical protein
MEMKVNIGIVCDKMVISLQKITPTPQYCGHATRFSAAC